MVDDPNAMTDLIFEAVRKTGQRALVSKGWGGLGGEDLSKLEGVFMVRRSSHAFNNHVTLFIRNRSILIHSKNPPPGGI